MLGAVRDTRPVECRLYDRNDKVVGTVQLVPVPPEHGPRRVEFKGKRYVEGGGDGSYYGANEFAEIVEDGDAK